MANRLLSLLAIALVCLSLSALAEEAADNQSAPPAYDPAKTMVAVLPVINETGKEDKQADALLACSRKAFDQELGNRGFQLVPEDTITKAIADKKVDLTDEEFRTKKSLVELGQAVGANIIMMPLLQPTKDTISVGMFAKKKKEAVIDLKAVDVSTGMYVINSSFKASAKGSAILGGLSKSGSLREEATRKAVTEALKEFLKPYKEIKKDKPAQ